MTSALKKLGLALVMNRLYNIMSPGITISEQYEITTDGPQIGDRFDLSSFGDLDVTLDDYELDANGTIIGYKKGNK